MEFWGVEVQSGKPLKVTPEEDAIVHISQASLGDCKNNKGESVALYVKVGDQKLVMGTLSSESIPQINFDLVFEKEFELSHNWGKGSVFFVGYKSPNIDLQEGGEYFSDSEEEDAGTTITANPKSKAQVKKNAKLESADDEEEGPEASKKRKTEAAPVSAKKAKAAATPQKPEEKKTPTQSPKSASQVSCASCKKTFNSGNALESHNKAKHAAAK